MSVPGRAVLLASRATLVGTPPPPLAAVQLPPLDLHLHRRSPPDEKCRPVASYLRQLDQRSRRAHLRGSHTSTERSVPAAPARMGGRHKQRGLSRRTRRTTALPTTAPHNILKATRTARLPTNNRTYERQPAVVAGRHAVQVAVVRPGAELGHPRTAAVPPHIPDGQLGALCDGHQRAALGPD